MMMNEIVYMFNSKHLCMYRWTQCAEDLHSKLGNITGDMLLSSGVISYLGKQILHRIQQMSSLGSKGGVTVLMQTCSEFFLDSIVAGTDNRCLFQAACT